MDQSKLNKIPDEVKDFLHKPFELPAEDFEQPADFKPYKIYLLKRIFEVGYDEYAGKVIVASSAKAARKIANLKYGDEGPIWENANLVMCKEITLTMPLVVLESFRAG